MGNMAGSEWYLPKPSVFSFKPISLGAHAFNRTLNPAVHAEHIPIGHEWWIDVQAQCWGLSPDVLKTKWLEWEFHDGRADRGCARRYLEKIRDRYVYLLQHCWRSISEIFWIDATYCRHSKGLLRNPRGCLEGAREPLWMVQQFYFKIEVRTFQ
jgi:hypothetical protein